LSWTTPLLYRNVDSSIGNRATPTTNELESAHRQALKGRNGSRDTLLMSLAEDTGGRRSEILQLKFSEIPDLDAVDALADRPDAWWPIQVIRKGRRKGVLHLQPDTLYAIHGYLRVRAAVVKASREKWHDYVEPSELFLSSTTGAALKPDSVTALVGNYFRRIGLKLVNVHRIRARFAVDAVETTLDAFLELGIEFAPDSNWIETVLQQVATRMGHKNPSSLRHYLTVALERRIRVSYASAERLKLKRDRNSQLATEAALARAKFTSRLLADMDAYAGPLKRAAALRKHAAELEAQAAG
jgi:integrase